MRKALLVAAFAALTLIGMAPNASAQYMQHPGYGRPMHRPPPMYHPPMRPHYMPPRPMYRPPVYRPHYVMPPPIYRPRPHYVMPPPVYHTPVVRHRHYHVRRHYVARPMHCKIVFRGTCITN